jgi:hypothetical protein
MVAESRSFALGRLLPFQAEGEKVPEGRMSVLNRISVSAA